MPTVRRDREGYNVLSKRWGKNCTHQLSPEGQRFLQERFGDIDGLAIDRPTFFELSNKGLIYTKRRRPSPPRNSPPSKSPPREQPSPFDQAAVELVRCMRCSRTSPVGAKFCPNCGNPFVTGPAPIAHPSPSQHARPQHHAAPWLIVLLLLVIIAMIVYLGWFR